MGVLDSRTGLRSVSGTDWIFAILQAEASRENDMPIYKAPVEDVNFLLNDVFQIDRYDNLPGFTDASADVREAILGEAAKLAEEVLQPLNRTGDLEGCKRNADGSVSTTAAPPPCVGRKLTLSLVEDFGVDHGLTRPAMNFTAIKNLTCIEAVL